MSLPCIDACVHRLAFFVPGPSTGAKLCVDGDWHTVGVAGGNVGVHNLRHARRVRSKFAKHGWSRCVSGAFTKMLIPDTRMQAAGASVARNNMLQPFDK